MPSVQTVFETSFCFSVGVPSPCRPRRAIGLPAAVSIRQSRASPACDRSTTVNGGRCGGSTASARFKELHEVGGRATSDLVSGRDRHLAYDESPSSR